MLPEKFSDSIGQSMGHNSKNSPSYLKVSHSNEAIETVNSEYQNIVLHRYLHGNSLYLVRIKGNR